MCASSLLIEILLVQRDTFGHWFGIQTLDIQTNTYKVRKLCDFLQSPRARLCIALNSFQESSIRSLD